jgi:hypothetical protein
MGMGILVFFLGFAVVSFVGLILYSVISTLRNEREKKWRFLEATARRLKGRHIPGGMMDPHSIEFEIAGRPANVEFEPSGDERSGRTTLTVRLGRPSSGTLHILREGFGYEFLKLFGAQDLSIGDRDFDREYVVKAMPESLAAEIFSPDRRAMAITAVRRLSGWSDPTIELTRDQLRVRVRDELTNEGSVVTLVKTATEFLGFIQGPAPKPTGIELGEVRTTGQSTCPVCGTAMGSGPVRCEACKTPHHKECWTYVGQCSTYACKGKRWVA